MSTMIETGRKKGYSLLKNGKGLAVSVSAKWVKLHGLGVKSMVRQYIDGEGRLVIVPVQADIVDGGADS